MCFTNFFIKCVKYTVPDSSDRRLRTALVLLRLLWRYLDANMTGATVQMNTPTGNKKLRYCVIWDLHSQSEKSGCVLLNVLYTTCQVSSDWLLRTVVVPLRLLWGYADANMTGDTAHIVAAEYFRVWSTLKCILRLALAAAIQCCFIWDLHSRSEKS